MKQIKITTDVEFYSIEELSATERKYVAQAEKLLGRSYAPYSQFNVAALVVTEGGETFGGTNQENASYPCGLCAERVALFLTRTATDARIDSLFIIARNKDGIVSKPVTPCGACRQVIAEYEQNQKSNIKIYMIGKDSFYKTASAQDLLPLSFKLK